jgi:hypothetical protein
MQLYSTCNEKGYQLKVQVPTTIFDPMTAVIRAYRGKKCVGAIYFDLKKMPYWYDSARTIMIGKHDEKTLEQKTEELLRRLPNREE